MPSNYRERRAFIANILRAGEPRIYSQPQLQDLCNEAGFEVNTRQSITQDLDILGAVKTKPPGRGHYYYVIPNSRAATRAVDEAAAHDILHGHLYAHGLEVTDVSGMKLLAIRTAPQAAPFVAAPMGTFRPDGVMAVMSGSDAVLLFVEPEKVEGVKVELGKMMSRPVT